VKKQALGRGRTVITYFLVAAFWAVACARLVQIQVVSHDQGLTLAENQAQGWVDILPRRGCITDRHGRRLASNQSKTSYAAVPEKYESKAQRDRAARRFASLGSHTVSEWKTRFKSSPQFVYVARGVSPEVNRKIRSWKDPAVFVVKEQGRTYPTGGPVPGLLGRVDIDGVGQAGIEKAFETVLAGRPARGRVRYDAKREPFLDRLPASLAADGNDLNLTLDWEWQGIVEAELAKAVATSRAKGGGAIFITPDGAIRALAYSSNATGQPAGQNDLCRPVTDLFEPGSIFKAVTAAALLAEGLVRLDDTVYADSGLCQFGDRWIRDSEPHLWLTFAESFVVSSNIAFGKWAQRMDGSHWYRWVRDFGFGEVTGLGMPAEPNGMVLSHKRWTDLHKAQLAMGHSIAVTPLQMVIAFASFANGGDLYRPRLAAAISSPSGDTLEVFKPQKIRHLMSRDVVKQMGTILTQVVTEGTAQPAKSEAMAIAGKTGTAQKVREEGGGYYQNRFMASFVGYFPADRPQVVGIVYLDEPRTTHFGGWTAAPAFTRIAERLAVLHPELLRYPQSEVVKPRLVEQSDPEMTRGVVPDLRGLPLTRALACAVHCGFEPTVTGSGVVVSQSPAPGTRLQAGETVTLYGRHVVSPQEKGRA
jgi:cell division protein FtsI/penicillin-binding protein 2